MSSAMCDTAARSLNQVTSSTVQIKEKPYSLTPMYLLVMSKGGMGNYKKHT